MEFTMGERIVLLNTLRQVTGNVAELRILQELRLSLAPTEEDIKRVDIVFDDEGTRWNAAKDKPKEIEVGDAARRIIVRRLKELDSLKQLSQEHLIIIDKFPEVEE